jgi:hypothetical protein
MNLPDTELHQIAKEQAPEDIARAEREHEARAARGSLLSRIVAKLRRRSRP